MNKFDEKYNNVIYQIMRFGTEEINKRTGHKTKSIPGVTLQIDLEEEGFPLLSLRRQPIKSPIAEQIWFLSGSNKPSEFLNDYTKIWDAFTEDDGTVAAAYGYRWKHHFGKNQIESLIKLLEDDNSSRHGVVVTWDPKDDGFSGTPKKNVPCPYTFTVNIIGGRLNLHNIIRSNDMILGCPFDVIGFALLQCILAQRLNVKQGVYTHSISNAHIYDIHYDLAYELIDRESKQKKIKLELPVETYERALQQDKDIVNDIFNILDKQYTPLESMGKIDIVL